MNTFHMDISTFLNIALKLPPQPPIFFNKMHPLEMQRRNQSFFWTYRSTVYLSGTGGPPTKLGVLSEKILEFRVSKFA